MGLPVILLRTQCACISSRQKVCKIYSLICTLGYIKTNIVSYISNLFRCATCMTLLDRDPVGNKPDNYMLAYIPSCMIKIFRRRGRGGDTFKTPLPYEQLSLLPSPVFRCFWKDPLMTPTNPLQASFTVTPSPSTIPPPSIKF